MSQPFNIVRCGLLLMLALAFEPYLSKAQTISGHFTGVAPAPAQIVLFAVEGTDQFAVDSVSIDRKGRFTFPRNSRGPGFFKLVVNDSDRVDIILSPSERELKLHFGGSPLQEHITVLASRENTAMWDYKQASRQAQMELVGIRDLRARTDPTDRAALLRLDSLEARVDAQRKAALERIVASVPASYFAKVVAADRELTAKARSGPDAIGALANWTDASLMRSTIYPKAIMTYLQSLPIDDPVALRSGVDSIMRWAAPDTACWRYARSFMFRVFDQYGPDELAQHILDQYMIGKSALLPMEPALQLHAAERLRLSPGAPAPNVALVDPINGSVTSLQDALNGKRYVLLFFYSSTCEHCHEQMPGLKLLYERYATKGFQVLGLALDVDLDEFTTTIQHMELPWPGYSELNGWGSQAAKAFRVKATPSMVLLDGQGMIVAKPYDHAELAGLIGQLLP